MSEVEGQEKQPIRRPKLKRLNWAKKTDEGLAITTPIGRVVVALHPQGEKSPAFELIVHVSPRRGVDDPEIAVQSGPDGTNGIGDGNGIYTQLTQGTVRPKPRVKDFMPPELTLKGRLTGRPVVLSQAHYAGDTVSRVMIVSSGCQPRRSKVYGTIKATGEAIETRRKHIARFASDAECEAAHARWNAMVNA